jgi:uncharacterized protein
MKKLLCLLLPLAVLFTNTHSQSSKDAWPVGIPAVTHSYVNDYTGTMLAGGQVAQLNHSLKLYQHSTTSQIVVVCLDTLPNDQHGQKWDLESFSNNLFKTWLIGQKGKNNGVLLIIVLNDRQARIATGTGMEGALPDVTCLNIIENDLKPQFRQEHYYEAIVQTIAGIKQAMGHEYTADPKQSKNSGMSTGALVGLICAVIVFIFIIVVFLTHNDDSDDEEEHYPSSTERDSYYPDRDDTNRNVVTGVAAAAVIASEDDDDEQHSSTNVDEDDDNKDETSPDDDTFTPGDGDTAGGGASGSL